MPAYQPAHKIFCIFVRHSQPLHLHIYHPGKHNRPTEYSCTEHRYTLSATRMSPHNHSVHLADYRYKTVSRCMSVQRTARPYQTANVKLTRLNINKKTTQTCHLASTRDRLHTTAQSTDMHLLQNLCHLIMTHIFLHLRTYSSFQDSLPANAPALLLFQDLQLP